MTKERAGVSTHAVEGQDPEPRRSSGQRRRWLALVAGWTLYMGLWLYLQVGQPPLAGVVGCPGPSTGTGSACVSTPIAVLPPIAMLAIFVAGLAAIAVARWLTARRSGA